MGAKGEKMIKVPLAASLNYLELFYKKFILP